MRNFSLQQSGTPVEKFSSTTAGATDRCSSADLFVWWNPVGVVDAADFLAAKTATVPPELLAHRTFRKMSIVLEIELWCRLVPLVSQVPSDCSNLNRQLNTTSSNFY
jgi:hypothetical protein